jgi:IS5 family transposase
MSRLPDRVSIQRFRRLPEQHRLAVQFLATVNAQISAKGYMLKEGTTVDATVIAAPTRIWWPRSLPAQTARS